MRKFRQDISDRQNSITSFFAKHRDDLLWSKSVPEIAMKVKKIFEDNNISTNKSREIMFKLEHDNMKLDNAIIYIQNTIYAGSGMATY